MFCSKCGKEVKDGAAACDKCGNAIKPAAESGTVSIAPAKAVGKKKSLVVLFVILGAAAAAVLLLIAGPKIAAVFRVKPPIPKAAKTKQQFETEACRAGLGKVQSALELFYTHYKCYPEELNRLIDEGYIRDNSDKDPWGRELWYETLHDNGSRRPNNYYLGSAGPDGKWDTVDDVEPPINTGRHSFRK
jgi:uncharacterized membrane protein YvbJ